MALLHMYKYKHNELKCEKNSVSNVCLGGCTIQWFLKKNSSLQCRSFVNVLKKTLIFLTSDDKNNEASQIATFSGF